MSDVWGTVADGEIPYLSTRFIMEKFLSFQDEEIRMSERQVFSELEQLTRSAKTVEQYLKGQRIGQPYFRDVILEPTQLGVSNRGAGWLESDLMAGLAREITNELDAEILGDLRALAGEEIDVSSTSIGVEDFEDAFQFIQYKGQSEFDAGYFFCPYVPVMWHRLPTNEISAFDLARTALTHPGVINYDASV